MTPDLGAAQIWQRCVYHKHIPEVRSFVGCASEWEDQPQSREHYERLILSYAEDVLARRTESYRTAG